MEKYEVGQMLFMTDLNCCAKISELSEKYPGGVKKSYICTRKNTLILIDKVLLVNVIYCQVKSNYERDVITDQIIYIMWYFFTLPPDQLTSPRLSNF